MLNSNAFFMRFLDGESTLASLHSCRPAPYPRRIGLSRHIDSNMQDVCRIGCLTQLIGAADRLSNICRTHQRYGEGVAIGTRRRFTCHPMRIQMRQTMDSPQTKPLCLFDIRTRLSPEAKGSKKPLLLRWRNRVAMIGNDDALYSSQSL